MYSKYLQLRKSARNCISITSKCKKSEAELGERPPLGLLQVAFSPHSRRAQAISVPFMEYLEQHEDMHHERIELHDRYRVPKLVLDLS